MPQARQLIAFSPHVEELERPSGTERHISCPKMEAKGGIAMRKNLPFLLSGLMASNFILFGLNSGYSQAQVREERRTTTTTTEVRGVSAVIGASVRLTAGETFGK